MKRWLLLTLICCACSDSNQHLSRIAFGFEVAGLARDADEPLTVHTPLGWDVTIVEAQLSFAAIYFRNAPSVTGTAEDSGRITAQVLGPFVVDTLDPEPARPAVQASAVTERALSAELWLTEAQSGPIAETFGAYTALAHFAGVAQKGELEVPFDGALTFPLTRDASSYQVWSNRRIRRVPSEFVPSAGGRLRLEVDPSHFFDAVSFDTLTPDDATRDFTADGAAVQLRSGLAAVSGYRFSFEP
jgi:hypothetical protein